MATQQLPQLQTEPRERIGTRYAQRLRESGRLPGVIYGHKQANVAVSIDAKALQQLLRDNAHLVEAVVAGKTEPCLVKDVQWDHLGSNIIHIDLTRVDLAEEVDVDVALELLGEPAALKEAGAVLNHPLAQLAIKCRADSIPRTITCDISELALGESITVSNLTLPAGVTAQSDADTIVAQISMVAEAPEEDVVAAEAGGDEPQVIGKAEGDSEDDKKADEEKE